MSNTIYTVVGEGWTEGDDLLSLLAQITRGDMTYADAEAMLADRWPDMDACDYLNGDAAEVHCHETLEQARDYQSEYAPNGRILAIDTETLDVRDGAEYPHPVVLGIIPASCITPVD